MYHVNPHLANVYVRDRLDEMRAAALRVADGYSEVRRGGTHQARLERDAEKVETVSRLLGELREAWADAALSDDEVAAMFDRIVSGNVP